MLYLRLITAMEKREMGRQETVCAGSEEYHCILKERVSLGKYDLDKYKKGVKTPGFTDTWRKRA